MKKKIGKTRQAKIKKVQIFHKSFSLGESLLDVPICVCMRAHTCLRAYLFRTMGSSCPYFVICNLLFTYQGLNAFNCHLALFIPPQVSPPAVVSCLQSFTKWHPKSTQPRSVGNTEDFSSYPTEAVVICFDQCVYSEGNLTSYKKFHPELGGSGFNRNKEFTEQP